MQQVNAVLKANSLQLSDLPADIQADVQDLRNNIVKFNEAVDDYDAKNVKDDEAEKQFDAIEDDIKALEDGIVVNIEAFVAEKKVKATQTAAAVTSTPEPKKEGSSWGAIGVGILVLAVTLGAVNLLRKKG